MRFRRSASPAAVGQGRFTMRVLLLIGVGLLAAWAVTGRGKLFTPDSARITDSALPPSPLEALGDGVVLATSGGIPPAIQATTTTVEAVTKSSYDLGVDTELVSRVNDRTSGIPQRPYFHLVEVALQHSVAELRKQAKTEAEVSYANLWTQPSHHRGELVYLEGHLRGLTKFEVTNNPNLNPSGVTTLYQGDLFTSAAHPQPYVIIIPNIPAGMPTGKEIVENVKFVGFFLKQWRYKSAAQVDRAAPLLIGQMVSWTPAPPPTVGSESRNWLTVSLAGAVAGIALLVWLLARCRPTPARSLGRDFSAGELNQFVVLEEPQSLLTLPAANQEQMLENNCRLLPVDQHEHDEHDAPDAEHSHPVEASGAR